MTMVIVEISIIFLLILCNGVLAMTETCFVASRKPRMEQWAAQGRKGSAVAVELLENPTRFLSTIQVGISLIGIFTGVFGGATIGEELTKWLSLHELVHPYAETLSIVCVVVAITYFSVVFGEIVPKRLGLINPEGGASLMAAPMRLMAMGLAPAVSILGKSTDFVLRLLRAQTAENLPRIEEEIRFLLREGISSGDMEHMEGRMVERVLRLGDQRAGAIMTPRTEIRWLNLNASIDSLMEDVREGHHSIYPVGNESIDNVQGFVRTRDILIALLENRAPDIAALMTPAAFLPATTTALDVLITLKDKGHPAVFLVDEHGGLEGMITLSDVLKAILGAIPERGAKDAPMIVRREDGSFLLDGMLNIDEFKSTLSVRSPEEDTPAGYHTLGGFVMGALERIPVEGDAFEWRGFRIEVVDMDGNRVDKVLVRKINVQ